MVPTARLEPILSRVAKPARYAGGEFNACRKDPQTVKLRFCLVFPDVYEVGMSSLGFQIIYHAINSRDDAYCERAFTPWGDMEQEMRSAGVPLYTLETRTSLQEMDAIGFSIGSEATYTNVLTCLDLAGVPLRSEHRTERSPVVIAGGHCAFSPEPLAPFVDAFVVGEGEEVVHEVLDCLIRTRELPRAERLLALAGVEGVYVPSLVQWQTDAEGRPLGFRAAEGVRLPVRKRLVEDFASLAWPEHPVVPSIEAIHDRVSVEVMRGCTQGCRFCQAGIITRPVRERPAEKVLQIAEELIPATGYDEVSLLSLSTADYSGVECVLRAMSERLAPKGVGVSLPSLRVDAFSVNLSAEIQKVRKTGLTFAPEAGTERLRRVINKKVSDEDLFSAARAAWTEGWKRIKLYFMIGLPTETDEDVRGIADLVRELRRRAREQGVRPEISVSVASFVPKPHTPFQWRAQDSPEELGRKVNLLKDALRIPGVKFSWNDPGESQLWGALARGDRRLADVVERAWRLGARFDGWDECQKWDAWDQAFSETGADPAWYAGRKRDYDEPLPWDQIDSGVTKEFLAREDALADACQESADCRRSRCAGCGVSRFITSFAEYGNCYHN